MSNHHVEIDPVLVERFANGNGTIFVGSGISSGSGMPVWRELIEPLRRDVGSDIEPSANYLDIAELYETLYGRSELENYLRKMLGDVRFQLTRTHELIVGLPVQRIYTTNFDDLLEQASHRGGINRTVISNASQVGLSDTSKLSIVKLHGDLNDPASLVFTASDYYGYFTKNPAVADLLKVELQTRTVLFLGYSFSDFDLGMILGKVAAQSGATRPLLFSLQLQPTALAVAALRRRGVKAIGIDAVPGAPGASEKIETWLRSFSQALHKYERRRHFVRDRHFRVGDNYDIPQHKRWPIRTTTLSRIERGLRSEFPVVIVKGEPGIGKTQIVASAVSEAVKSRSHLLADEVYECVIWIRADPGGDPSGHTLDRILRSIFSRIHATAVLPSRHMPSDASDGNYRERVKKQEINQLLQQEKVLVVIDDLEQAGETELNKITEWLESRRGFTNPKSKIVVTSRSLILPGFVVEISPLSEGAAMDIVHEYVEVFKMGELSDESISRLRNLRGVSGNPQAIKLVLGLLNVRRGGAARHANTNEDIASDACALAALEQPLRDPSKRIDHLFKEIVCLTMQALERDAPQGAQILSAMLAFPEAEPIPPYLLRVAAGMKQGMSGSDFARTASVLVRSGLLDRDIVGDTYSMHRVTRKAVGECCSREAVRQAGKRLVDHLLEFLEDGNVIRRPEIDTPYWNALVRDEMARVDPYWRIIKHVVREVAKPGRAGQAGDINPVVRFALLLTHYMDSRFLNDERHQMIERALATLDDYKAANKGSREWEQETALLRIDALAWTQIEEMRLQEAEQEIRKGKELLPSEDKDLRALAACWMARIEIARKNLDAAEQCLEAARSRFDALNAWIRMRVEMMAGDLHHLKGQPERALMHYRTAEKLSDTYGGEGHCYQTSPRIGISLLMRVSLIDDALEALEDKQRQRQRHWASPGNNVDKRAEEEKAAYKKKQALERERDGFLREAEHRFDQLVDNEQVLIGHLYGRYGKAMIALRRRSARGAIHELQTIWQEIYHRGGPGNQLLQLTEQLYEKIKLRGDYRF